ncbi:rod shape-determining protein RodA [Thermaerobacter litoralis]
MGLLDRRLLKTLDLPLIALVMVLMACGLVLIAVAVRARGMVDLVEKQAIFAAAGLALMLAVTLWVDYRTLPRIQWYLYGAALVGLAAMLVVAPETNGCRCWINAGPISLQPAEFVKPILILVLADWLARHEDRPWTWWDLAPVLAIVVPPALLVLKQPDLGTVLVFFGIAGGMLLMAGYPAARLFGLAVAGLAAAVALVWAQLRFPDKLSLLEPHQLMRLVVFINPYNDGQNGLGAGYHVLQSRLAVGNGRLFGQGLTGASQTATSFLPEPQTDFIFAVAAETLGFVGITVLVLLLLGLLLRALHDATQAGDTFGMLLGAGVVSMLATHFIINAGMTVGLMPITGLPLPFISYGGSNLITNCLSLGLLMSAYARRHKILF